MKKEEYKKLSIKEFTKAASICFGIKCQAYMTIAHVAMSFVASKGIIPMWC